jgi:hypothetical protein
MASLENGSYEFRNQAGDSTPRGLSNFPNWFTPLVGSGGKPNVRPADVDMALQHSPFGSQQWEGALFIEFKPAGYGALGYAQSGILQWAGKMPNSYGMYIEDNMWDIRTKQKYTEDEMSELYKVTVYKDGRTYTVERTLTQIYEAIKRWWETGDIANKA